MAQKSLPSFYAAAALAGLALCCIALVNLNALTPQLERDAVRLRGLERRQAIHWATVNRQQLQTYIRDLFMQQYAPGELRREGTPTKRWA